MKIIAKLSGVVLPLLVLITLPLIDGYSPTCAGNPELSKVTFYVR